MIGRWYTKLLTRRGSCLVAAKGWGYEHGCCSLDVAGTISNWNRNVCTVHYTVYCWNWYLWHWPQRRNSENTLVFLKSSLFGKSYFWTEILLRSLIFGPEIKCRSSIFRMEHSDVFNFSLVKYQLSTLKKTNYPY